MYPRFGLTLMVTHDCNMRCSYCYAGRKRACSMPAAVGRRSIDRALASVAPGGTLELGFFGGEPLLEAALVSRLAGYASRRSAASGAHVTFALTTNGTMTGAEAWGVLTRRDFDVAVSFDGLPEVHDRHRRFADGGATSLRVLATMRRLIDSGKDVRVVTVVRPDTAVRLAGGLAFLRDLGVSRVDPTLDLWAEWTAADASRLEQAIAAAALVWREGLPGFGVSWFDEKAARLAGCPIDATARCGFGASEIAVAPSGDLYPCERLIGEDQASNPMRLPGNARDGSDFLGFHEAPARSAAGCSECPAASLCNTTCRCGNYVRTGNVTRPDRLLCLVNQACLREVAGALAPEAVAGDEREVGHGGEERLEVAASG